jgi:3-deoxy-manno-octulosonate cytidylyltransferase (CMP-KDO synthetase)
MVYGIIPSRYDSTRFPGKALVEIDGMPMFWHVYQRAVLSGVLDSVWLATDDMRICNAAIDNGVPVLMTEKHESGTDRVLEAAEFLGVGDDDTVVNIQGDEPYLEPAMIREILEPNTNVTTIARKESDTSRDKVKVRFGGNGTAIAFSRDLISGYVQAGLYAFKMKFLRLFGELGECERERVEGLEQLRFMEAGVPIHVVVTEHKTYSVDRPKDLEGIGDGKKTTDELIRQMPEGAV